jgi:nitrate reductase NapE
VSRQPAADAGDTRRNEWTAFVFLAVVLAPVLAVLIVSGYGFLVWIWQMVAGPPGPPPP